MVKQYNNRKSHAECKVAGMEYEDWVQRKLWQEGFIVGLHSSYKYQQSHGESISRTEIKHDRKFRKYKNLYIEIRKRIELPDGPMIPANLFKDNPRFFVIGDHDTFWVFAGSHLRFAYEHNIYSIGTTKSDTEEWGKVVTSEGMLVPFDSAEKLKIFSWGELP
jgi:hypothetical protein